MNRKEKERRETPIRDGDARPDLPVDGGRKKEQPGKEKKFEQERISDINSLEDYKDAKTDREAETD
ncbi:MAG TPA: hypothetical protein VF490_09150 [Chryseosolibacter sp.]